MIQITILAVLFAIGAALCMRNKEDSTAKSVVGIALMVLTGSSVATVLLGILIVHVDSGSEIVSFNQTRGVVASIKTGDPSYSGILTDAMKKNSQLAVAKERNPSLWWDWFYSDDYCKLTPILMPGQK